MQIETIEVEAQALQALQVMGAAFSALFWAVQVTVGVAQVVAAQVAVEVVADAEIKNKDMSKIKTVKFRGKVSDRFDIQLKDVDGNKIYDEGGYMPNWLSVKDYDDVSMEIDNETGRILNWVPIGDEVLEEYEDEF